MEAAIDASTYTSHLKAAVARVGSNASKGILRLLWRLFRTKALPEMLGTKTARFNYQHRVIPSPCLMH